MRFDARFQDQQMTGARDFQLPDSS